MRMCQVPVPIALDYVHLTPSDVSDSVNEDQSDDWFSIVLAQPVFGLKTDISMRGVL